MKTWEGNPLQTKNKHRQQVMQKKFTNWQLSADAAFATC